MNKELFRKTEAILYDYNNLSLKIDLLKAEIKDIEETYQGCGAIGYEEKIQATNKFNSAVENEILQKEKMLNALKIDLSNKVKLKRRIDLSIQTLKTKEEKDLVRLKYINNPNASWGNVAYILRYNKDYCRKDLRTKIIKQISDFIFYNPGVQEGFVI